MGKIKLSTILYSALFLITAVLIVSLSVWAAGGSTFGAAVNYIDGEVALEEGVRSEYLVGEEVSAAGITLTAGGKTYSADEIEINVDNASAGDKMVEVFHREGSDYYRGYFPVTYFLVRHLDMHKTPTSIRFDGEDFKVEGMELWAELSGQPTSFPQPTEPGLETVIILSEDDYTIDIQEDEIGGYFATIGYGKFTVTIYLIETDGEMVILDNADRILHFTNENGTDESLTLYITSWGGTEAGKYNVAEGFFILNDASGKHKYQFDYYLQDGTWASVFHSEDLPGSIYRRDPDGEDALIVQIGDLIFSGTRYDWRLAIFNNPNS